MGFFLSIQAKTKFRRDVIRRIKDYILLSWTNFVYKGNFKIIYK